MVQQLAYRRRISDDERYEDERRDDDDQRVLDGQQLSIPRHVIGRRLRLSVRLLRLVRCHRISQKTAHVYEVTSGAHFECDFCDNWRLTLRCSGG